MGRGASDNGSDPTSVGRRSGSFGRIGPTARGFDRLLAKLDPDGWKGPYRFDYWERTEQKVFTSSDGYGISAKGPLPGFLRARRNVSLLLRYEDDHITVMEEILHPSGILFRRHECGADIDKAVETFGSSIRALRGLEVGVMAKTQHDLPREWLASLIADRFRSAARHQIKATIRDRQRQVELDAQGDVEAIAADLMAEAGFDRQSVIDQPA